MTRCERGGEHLSELAINAIESAFELELVVRIGHIQRGLRRNRRDLGFEHEHIAQMERRVMRDHERARGLVHLDAVE